MVIIVLFFNWIRNVKLIPFYKGLKPLLKGMFWYVILGSFVFGMTLYNLGLASRQKFMIVPELMLLLVIVSGKKANEKN